MKKIIKLYIAILTWSLFVLPVFQLTLTAQENAETGVLISIYKTVDDTQLKAHIVLPDSNKGNTPYPAFLFFHGGGWSQGKPENGIRMCHYWAERGMVGISFEYRLAGENGVTPIKCIKDAKSAIRWVRSHASELGVDPCRIVATGGSAGGHLAVSTAVLDGFDEADDDTDISASPDAVIGWSAAVNVAGDTWFRQLLGDRADVRDCSPAHHVQPGLPPMLLLHGSADATVPCGTVERFVKDMKEAGNQCKLVTYKDGDHIFHVKHRAHVLAEIQAFLKSLNYL